MNYEHFKLAAAVADDAILYGACRCFCHRIRHIRRRLYQDFMAEPGASLVHTRVGIVDAFAPTSEHGTPPSVLQCELQPLGYARSASIGSKAATPIRPS